MIPEKWGSMDNQMWGGSENPRVEYSEKFRSRMVQRMAMPGGPSANALASEVGVSQGTLSRWLREASSVGPMASKRDGGRTRSGGKRRAQDLGAQEKLRLLIEASKLKDEELGCGATRQLQCHVRRRHDNTNATAHTCNHTNCREDMKG